MIRDFLSTWTVDRGPGLFDIVTRGFLTTWFGAFWQRGHFDNVFEDCWQRGPRFFDNVETWLSDFTLFDMSVNVPPVYGDKTGCAIVRCGGENGVNCLCVSYDVVINFYWEYICMVYIPVGPCDPESRTIQSSLTGTIAVSLSWWHTSKYMHITCSKGYNYGRPYDEFILSNKTSKSL